MNEPLNYGPKPGILLVAGRSASPGAGRAVVMIFHAGADGCMGVRLDTPYPLPALTTLSQVYPQLHKIPAGHSFLHGGPTFDGADPYQPCFVSVLASNQGLVLPPDTRHTVLPHGLVFIGHDLKRRDNPEDRREGNDDLPNERVQFEKALFFIGLMAWDSKILEQEIRNGLWKLVPSEPDFVFTLAPQALFHHANGLPAHVYYQA